MGGDMNTRGKLRHVILAVAAAALFASPVVAAKKKESDVILEWRRSDAVMR